MPYKDPDVRRAYHREKSREWAQAHPEAMRQAVRRHREKNIEEFRAASRSYHESHRDERNAARRRNSLRHKYGMALDEYVRLHELQRGLCLICERPETMLGSGGEVRPLAVDHDHKTGKVRGLLCAACNAGLGYFRDDAELFMRAYRYLLTHRPKEVVS